MSWRGKEGKGKGRRKLILKLSHSDGEMYIVTGHTQTNCSTHNVSFGLVTPYNSLVYCVRGKDTV